MEKKIDLDVMGNALMNYMECIGVDKERLIIEKTSDSVTVRSDGDKDYYRAFYFNGEVRIMMSYSFNPVNVLVWSDDYEKQNF